MKSTILLTTAIFLMSAPALDSKTVSEVSAGLLVPQQETGLLASEDVSKKTRETDKSKKPNTQRKRDTIKL